MKRNGYLEKKVLICYVLFLFSDHDKEDLGLPGEDIEHDENCLLKAMLENNVSLPQINKDSKLFQSALVQCPRLEFFPRLTSIGKTLFRHIRKMGDCWS